MFAFMRAVLRVGLFVAAALALASQARAGEAPARIIAIGGSVTEIVYALGGQERLVARDTTSTFPPEALDLPDVGYIRALSAEGVIGLAPDLIIALEGAGPPEVMAVIRESGIALAEIPDGYDAAAISTKIRAVGRALGLEAKAEILACTVDAAIARAAGAAASADRPRALFILSMQGGRIMAAGADTHADGIIRLAGGDNVMAGISGYKPVSDEAVMAAAPDVVVMMDRTGDHAISDEMLFAHPALSSSPAASAHAVVRLDGMKLLGFGPRTAEAIAELSDKMRLAARVAN
ncbi:heme/hemin ABC transporter substrate-binding protein [Hoeflea marina]|nr:ABC transporter substrate-binding protein [Hoeflea marina]